jgi:SagB-type dehydrogenase family enzyme
LTYSLRIQQVAEREFGEISYRPVASGGARHPIDVFLAAIRVSDLQTGLYHYNPVRHQLAVSNGASTLADVLTHAVLDGFKDVPAIDPAITLFFTARPARTACKYRDRALTLIMNDLGCIIQQVYLIVHGLGLVGCAVGSVSPTIIEQHLGLDGDCEVFVGAFLVW